MSAPIYTVHGSTIFQGEHYPMTMLAARVAVGVHLSNAANQLAGDDERTLPTRLVIANVEIGLANELQTAIDTVTQKEDTQ
jgi:hemoglobin-like flavoprotein